MKISLDYQNERRKTLIKAVINAAEILELSDDEFFKILKIKKTSIALLNNLNYPNPISFDEEIAILFVSIFNLLHKLSGGDVDTMCYFIRNLNGLIGDIPIKKIESTDGLAKVYNVLGNISEKTFRP
ncbi:conserved hypothetical protein [Acinetobacter sp. 8I-beige]|uniref:hypothetical protein n=1 Tax=Acinetobacter sp. 8I-beige TaxID=2653125 RepID=UPI0012F01E87|nr:hypothetical protein [Acinetobacter sp. 8I-beige]VXA86990.1 conserved hypothetical protein [Acinetobacter sp. 8I-beige]